VLVWACDDLAEAVEEVAGRDAVFGAVHQELAARPTVMIVEDVHWADERQSDLPEHVAAGS
jgi:hypothetical protein